MNDLVAPRPIEPRPLLWYKVLGGASFYQAAGGVPRLFLYGGAAIGGELSIFVDESGGQNGRSAFCIVSLVLHEQDDDLGGPIAAYEGDLRSRGLPDIPFHASPLMYGKGPYAGMGLAERKAILSCFEAFCRRAPFTCKTFSYPRREVARPEDFAARLKRDLVVFLADNLAYFQGFERVKIYYDNGQQMITGALHDAIDFMLSRQAVLYRMADAREYRLSQAADCVCALELADAKFRAGALTETDAKVFGASYAAFKKNHLRHIRKKSLG